jgi:hypothetical protein
MTRKSLNGRVTQAAEAAFAQQQYVSATDVLVGLGWLTPSHIDRWRQGRIESLESVAPVDPSKVAAALEALQRWAQDRRLNPAETDYVARTRDRRPLRFSVSGDPPSKARTAHTGCRQTCSSARSSGRADPRTFS